MHRIQLLLTAPALLLLTGGQPAAPSLEVHEWGTFTAVAGVDGVVQSWRPLLAPSDLPEFVYDAQSPGIRAEGVPGKGDARGTIRMETPVLYFYSDEPQVVEVSVDFPSGSITEWYPHARAVRPHGIDWGQMTVGVEAPELPHDGTASHYYPARNVDAGAVRLGDGEGVEYERFLFYRGVGAFDLPLAVTVEPGGVVVQPAGGRPGTVVVFESRDGRVGFSTADYGPEGQTVPRPALDSSVDDVVAELERQLVGDGLFPKEARAMTDTWRSDWFEDGLRVFWLLDRAETDALLPLTVTPAPDRVVRTMVGRVEIITPELTERVRHALRHGDADGLAAEARFLEPVLGRIADTSDDPDVRRRAAEALQSR